MPAAAARTLEVLAALAAGGEPLSVGQLAAKTGIARASLSRLLISLREDGAVAVDETGRFRATFRILEPGLALIGPGSVRDVSFPHMAELSAAVGYEVNLGLYEYPDVVFIERVFGIAGRVSSRLEMHRRPLLASHSGRVMVAFRSSGVEEALISSGATEDEHSAPMTPEDVRAELKHIRSQGYIAFDRHVETGAPAGLSVPIFDSSGLAVAGLTITRTTQLTAGFVHATLPKALHVSERISSELGHRAELAPVPF